MLRDQLVTDLRRQLPDELSVGLCVVDDQMRVVDWNRTMERWTGIARQQIQSELLSDFYPQLKEPRYLHRIQEAVVNGLPTVFSAAIHKHFIPVQVATLHGLMYQETVVQSIPGFPGYVVISITDVTARYLQAETLRRDRDSLKKLMANIKRQSEALQAAQIRATQANQTKTEFLANVSHEIRTPMTAILGFTEILMDDGVDEETRQSAVETIRSNGEHLLTLINDILDISKIEAGRLELAESECNISELLENLKHTFTHRAKERQLDFKCEIDEGVPMVLLTDPLRLRQLLLNLLSNALKFTEQGVVSLKVSSIRGRHDSSPMVRFDVIDTGIGMSPEQVSRLFQAFVQVDTSAARRFSGTGLGLVICKRVIELLGGSIEVTSTPGAGSCFTLFLPTGVEHLPSTAVSQTTTTINAVAAPKPRASRPVRTGGPLTGLRVLLAEDGPDNQRLLEFRLARDGAQSVIAENGRVAVNLALSAEASDEPFDLILMDMQMPELDGYDATRELRANDYTRPIIALTAHAMSHDRQRCLDAGCTGYHTKPVNWNDLRELILDSVHCLAGTN